MKTIVYYECEICGQRSSHFPSIEMCEAKGRPDLSGYPQGLIHGDPNKGFYKGITFVVAEIREARGCPHYMDAALWAFRDNSAGDSLGLDDLCGPSGFFSLGKHDVPDRTHPTFKRALAFLKKHKIKPMIWDGTKAVKL